MKITVSTLQKLKQEAQKIVMLTCYDASFASLMADAGVEMLLVGDSLGMVIQGETSTLPVTLDQMVYHTRCVMKHAKQAMVVADLPFGAYQQSPQQAFEAAARLMAAGAEMVKLEGGEYMAETVRFLVQRGIPVCAHIGLTPQSVHTFGGYKVQGRTDSAAEQLKQDAKALEAAGAALVLMEMVPAALAKEITASLQVPTIGIGAGVDVDGQVLVVYDMLGIYPGKKARFVKNFMQGATSIGGALESYVREVKAKTFPAVEHSF
ncbi:3-methyl-2-oxobutanoate hydroxymethyltransferase [Chitinimonas sp. BJB300]|uniref:3-methyl-2-oxobutanoate hydroxymethyltransferase n=1 Tax=Chitinimonas sp. BJB300 TaxID=1559339 RepID=UPI000C0CED7B|nr:3-methyl-2-oxobutanoate hydroxymethyltransferase [Chitinimonas sp. BJB300]PHV10277.1 3-methyl-2-oxobutanoate hydroxymethyltransferase [Chitinimonas sp. BJB300]TSJ84792.1 3-methyl-2-oxobutanoate hydroxymethyltransferase [Chitinimonas sp. BJB300]